MANRSRRPRRGPRDGSRQPQGGARPLKEEFLESGDLEAREFGVPQADIPGGVRHLVSPETIPHYPPGVYERPADYHKYHGVESDDGQYYPSPDDVGKPRDTVAVPKISDAVPVYIIEGGGRRRIRVLTTEGPMAFASGTTDPVRLASRDPRRTKFWITNENQPTLPGAPGAQGQSTGTIGSQTTPAAGTTITSQALAAGVYTVAWTVELSGTLAAADANNFQLTNGATQVTPSLNTATAGIFAQPGATVVIPVGGATLAVKNIALATTGAVYQAQLIVTPVPAAAAAGANPAGVRIGTLEDTADNRGLLILGNSTRDFNTQEAVYMTNQSGSTVTLSWGEETEVPAAGQGT